ncbi:MAG: flagellar hook-basal body complex protein FliE [Alphaproteobacteria bacterium]
MNVRDAIAAYSQTAQTGASGGMQPRNENGSSFGDFLESSLRQSVDTQHNAEKMSLKAISGKADINDLVMAVNNAEADLQTVVAVRDKVIQAYQELLRMPI